MVGNKFLGENKMNEENYNENWNRSKELLESYGVKFQNDDGTYKSFYEVMKEIA